MATYWLPSSSTSYSTSKSGVKYRIRIVENSFNSSARTLNITVNGYFHRSGTAGYTTDYAHKLTYTINGTTYSYTNAYGTYTIDDDGVYMNSCTVDVPVNDDGTVSISAYCQYTSTNSSNLTSSNNGGTISLTTQAAKTYTISFNANGGSGAPSSQTKYHGTTLTLSSTKPTYSGRTFLGWSTSSSATSATYSAGGSYTNNESVTLYAVWSTLTTYTVSYNANGGSNAPASQVKTYGVTLTLTSDKPTRTGYNFLGWGTSSSATSVSYYSGGSYTSNASITLYAIWQIQTYTISYNANGGSGAPSSQTKTYGTALTLSSDTPTRTRHTFLGWSTSKSATSASYSAGGSFTTNATTTLYAVWSLDDDCVKIYSTGIVEAVKFMEVATVEDFFAKGGIVYATEFIEVDSATFYITSDGKMYAKEFIEI